MVVKSIESYEEFKSLIEGDKAIVIDFWATWCGPCKVIGPIFEKISNTPAGEKLGFYKVDVDTQEKIAAEVGIQAMPTFVFFHKGQAVKKVVGANPSALQSGISEVSSSL
ncbi:probable TRX2 - thioredoxin II [Ustilago sp. UG-2017b]|nr:probable TRX2 - thioredoxin II [Ustilago sp. UG-2017b]